MPKSQMKISFPKISLSRSVYLFYMTIHCSYGIPLILEKKPEWSISVKEYCGYETPVRMGQWGRGQYHLLPHSLCVALPYQVSKLNEQKFVSSSLTGAPPHWKDSLATTFPGGFTWKSCIGWRVLPSVSASITHLPAAPLTSLQMRLSLPPAFTSSTFHSLSESSWYLDISQSFLLVSVGAQFKMGIKLPCFSIISQENVLYLMHQLSQVQFRSHT